MFLAVSIAAFGQQAQSSPQQPQVHINYLNVCTPSDAEQQEIRSALHSLPAPHFSADFEISRGRSTMPDAPLANWVRVRREFPATLPFITAQYSISVDEKGIIETLVFRSREAKDVLEVQFEDEVTGAQSARSVLDTDTPVSRVKLERFGKGSVVLAQCPAVDQHQYTPLLQQASGVLARYRVAMGLKQLVPRELQALGALPEAKPKAKATNAAKKKQ